MGERNKNCNDYRMKWWGWGREDTRFDLENHPGIVLLLANKLGVKQHTPRLSWDIEDIEIPNSRLPQKICDVFVSKFGVETCSCSRYERILHCGGKSYKDLLLIRSLRLENVPDTVFFPDTASQVQEILQLCAQYRIAVVAFGGGTGVVSGLNPDCGELDYIAAMDMTRMNRILEIDDIAQTVTAQAGIFGPELDKRLRQYGFILGHYPQSFEFSTLGGWIATRSSGQNSILYGGIEKLVVSLTVVTAQGELTTFKCPRMATGPDLKEIFLGSEGVFGIIVDATLRIVPTPEQQYYFMLAFKNFADSSLAARKIAQSSLPAAMVRVSDEDESEAFLLMNKSQSSLFSKLAKKYLHLKGLTPPRISIMTIGLENSRQQINLQRKQLKKMLANFTWVNLGTNPGNKWLKDRFFLPYLRDELLDNNIFIDTLETSTSWSNLANLYHKVRKAILDSCGETAPATMILTHISHLYRDGASLYITILTPQKSDHELAQWQRIKTAANEAITSNHGVISHHHGVGLDHKKHLHWNNLQRKLVGDVKRSLDPHDIFNPGKLL